jgi:hypothetical protein
VDSALQGFVDASAASFVVFPQGATGCTCECPEPITRFPIGRTIITCTLLSEGVAVPASVTVTVNSECQARPYICASG